MIPPFPDTPDRVISHRDRLQNSALKYFEETSGASQGFIPGVSERYEDMAADFLENWVRYDLFSPHGTPAP